MFWLEMQAEWSRSLLELTEANIRLFSTAVETAIEAVQPEPEPPSPFAALFDWANPFVAVDRTTFAPLAELINGRQNTGQFMGSFGASSNPWVNPWLANVGVGVPWAAFMGDHGFMGNHLIGQPAFGLNLFGSSFTPSGNLWNANPWARVWHWAQSGVGLTANPFIATNPIFSGNPWDWLGQIPTMANMMAPVGNQVTAAWLAPFQPPRSSRLASPSAWNWPLHGSGFLH